MHIRQLTVNNVMRLEALNVEFNDDNLVIIGGQNGSGKTSVLRTIEATLRGAAALKDIPQPIRRGESEADSYIDLGDYKIYRRFKDDKLVALEVRTADGSKLSSAQSTLNGWLGAITFNPAKFIQMKPKEQVQAVLELLDLPFDLEVLNEEKARLFTERHAIGVQQRSARAAADQANVVDAPAERVDTAELMAEMSRRRSVHDAHTASVNDVGRLTSRREQLVGMNETLDNEAARCREQIAQLTARIEEIGVQQEQNNAKAAGIADEIAAAIAANAAVELPDLADIEARIAAAGETNMAFAAYERWVELDAAATEAEAAYRDYTDQIEAIETRKREALADVKLPAEGLSFDEDQVYYNGVPLSQACSAEQIVVSLAIGMASNPKIRVMLIPDGSLFDNDNLALIARIAKENDYQVFLERVGDLDGGFIIEEGTVVSYPDSYFEDDDELDAPAE